MITCIKMMLCIMICVTSGSASNNNTIVSKNITLIPDPGISDARLIQREINKQAISGAATRIILKGRFRLEQSIIISNRNKNLVIESSNTENSSLNSYNNATKAIEIIGGNGVRISGLRIVGFRTDGIFGRNLNNVIIDNNYIENTGSSGWSQGSIHFTGNVINSVISNNTIRKSSYSGIIVDNRRIDILDGINIYNNKVIDSCQLIDDCGAIYISDRSLTGKKIVIRSNVISNFGGPGVSGRGIYLDDWTSYARVVDNTIFGPGRFAFQIHGGGDNFISGNNIDMKNIIDTILIDNWVNGVLSRRGNNTFIYNSISGISSDRWKNIVSTLDLRNITVKNNRVNVEIRRQ